ncbi:protein of unknown function [Shewanella benthica]|uniref:Uncharacterized protein n=1 Tax=Shewanella benthica TaxID=43661 RepID=A0A330M509_9GAMM|nr:protein of unknown function [Shewanella benthica]
MRVSDLAGKLNNRAKSSISLNPHFPDEVLNPVNANIIVIRLMGISYLASILHKYRQFILNGYQQSVTCTLLPN